MWPQFGIKETQKIPKRHMTIWKYKCCVQPDNGLLIDDNFMLHTCFGHILDCACKNGSTTPFTYVCLQYHFQINKKLFKKWHWYTFS